MFIFPIFVPELLLLSTGTELLQYQAFQLVYSCAERTTIRWHYDLTIDLANTPRASSFYIDPDYPRDCQQFTTATYNSEYNRGHLVPSNDMDFNTTTMHQAHYMNNIVPQAVKFNGGIWSTTEVLGECLRDVNPVQIYGGLIYNDTSNDYFTLSHGIATPDWFWKVITTTSVDGEPMAIAWIIPNTNSLNPLPTYRVSVTELERNLVDGLGEIPIDMALKSDVTSEWVIPSDCDRS